MPAGSRDRAGPAGALGRRPAGPGAVPGRRGALPRQAAPRPGAARRGPVHDRPRRAASSCVHGTHMSHITHLSPAQYRRLARLLPPLDRPALLAGDMNMWGPPASSFFSGLAAGRHRPDLAGAPTPQPARPRPGHPRRYGWWTPGWPTPPARTTARWSSRWPSPDVPRRPGPGAGGSVSAMPDALDDFERSTFTAGGRHPHRLPAGHRTGGHRDQRDPRHHPERRPVRPDGGRPSAAPR